MKAPRPTRADQLREHRQIFEYARAHGLTLLEAKDAMARDRWKAAQGRLAAVRRCGRAIEPRPASTPAGDPAGANQHADAPWMMKD